MSLPGHEHHGEQEELDNKVKQERKGSKKSEVTAEMHFVIACSESLDL